MTVKVALVISDKNYRASPSGKGSIRKVQIRISWGANTDIEEAIEGVKALLSTALQFSR